MRCRPFADQPKRPSGQRARQHLERLDDQRGLLSGVARMKVRPPVLPVIHGDDDPVEAANSRHAAILQFLPAGRPENWSDCRGRYAPIAEEKGGDTGRSSAKPATNDRIVRLLEEVRAQLAD